MVGGQQGRFQSTRFVAIRAVVEKQSGGDFFGNLVGLRLGGLARISQEGGLGPDAIQLRHILFTRDDEVK